MKSPLRALLLCCTAFAFAHHARAQKPQPKHAPPAAEDEVETVSTSLVTVPVRVSDHDGRFIADLKREQFRIFEDGTEQEISFFETADKPFTVALMLDMSDSARFKHEEIQAAASAFVDQLRAGDRVMLVAFDKNISVLAEATGDRRVLYEAISRARSGGGTSFYDAVDEIVSRRLSRVPGRKAVVILTDGVDTTSRTTLVAAASGVEESGALVYCVQYDTMNDTAKPQLGGMTVTIVTPSGELMSVAYNRATHFMQLIADKTGGRFYRADTTERLAQSFARIAAELREQYSLGYYPRNRTGEGERRKLKVTVAAPGATVHARSAYVFKPRRVARRERTDALATLMNN